MQSSSPFAAVLDIFVAPSRALNGVKDSKYWTFLPFLLYMGLPIAFLCFYFLGHDFESIKEQMLAAMGDRSPAEKEQAANFLTPHTVLVTSTLFFSLFSLLMFCMQGLYLMFATKVDPENIRSFPDWFALTVWAHFPEIIGTVLSFVLVLASSTVPDLNSLNMLSLNGILNLPPGHPWQSFATTFGLFSIWSLFLTGLGIQLWTKIDKARAWVIAALPYVVIYGIWALVLVVKGS
ncbi:YIP1 family protein [Gallaecimonas kandeliae]|uniref:YIP1 family protein n=1 Tax=Gallaecimonas kandeliae TaxID=3029055 RepID=UPI002647FAF0|nr:YIP1 family protein [Gallaecimonas kandeliae]WKE64016.1 YIP1 family protein [Gallaecimonas kandeliae]